MAETQNIHLATWLTRGPDGMLYIDPDIAYPAMLKALGVEPEDIDQYWLEVCYQCVKLETDRIALERGFHPRQTGIGLSRTIMSEGGRKQRWAIKNYPDRHADVWPGTNTPRSGVDRATNGKEAREHYKRIRGFVPA